MIHAFFKELGHLIVRWFVVGYDFFRGLWVMRKLTGPSITVLGGLRVRQDDPYSQQTFTLSRRLVKRGFSIITGGGAGIMVSANCGASSVCPQGHVDGRKTIGIGLKAINHGFINACAPVYKTHYFFVRKWFLFHHSVGFIFFPGGIGTADEFFELLDLVNFGMLKPRFIILIGTSFWRHLIEWYMVAMKDNLITLPPQDAFLVCDNSDEALEKIMSSCTDLLPHPPR
jgi:uncharacterized protein (TIGR00730 family)